MCKDDLESNLENDFSERAATPEKKENSDEVSESRPRRRRGHVNYGDLRVIKTARDEQSINQAVEEGFFPLIKPVLPSNEIRSKYAVFQNPETGEIRVTGDLRARNREPGFEEVIGFTFYYPHSFPSPFAAYLLPADLKVGERVYLEDIIEDIVGRRWNQGDTYRLNAYEAIWNGEGFEIQFQPPQYDVIG